MFDDLNLWQHFDTPSNDDHNLDLLTNDSGTSVDDIHFHDPGRVSDHRLITAVVTNEKVL